MVVEGAVVNHVTTTLEELPDVDDVTASVLEGCDAVVFPYYTPYKRSGGMVCVKTESFTLCMNPHSLCCIYV